MATLEEVLAALNSAVTDVREVLTKVPEIATKNGDVSFTFADGTQVSLPGLPKLQSQVDNFIAGARGEYPFVNILANPYMLDTDGDGNLDSPLPGYVTGDYSIEVVWPPKNRTPISRHWTIPPAVN